MKSNIFFASWPTGLVSCGIRMYFSLEVTAVVGLHWWCIASRQLSSNWYVSTCRLAVCQGLMTGVLATTMHQGKHASVAGRRHSAYLIAKCCRTVPCLQVRRLLTAINKCTGSQISLQAHFSVLRPSCSTFRTCFWAHLAADLRSSRSMQVRMRELHVLLCQISTKNNHQPKCWS